LEIIVQIWYVGMSFYNHTHEWKNQIISIHELRTTRRHILSTTCGESYLPHTHMMNIAYLVNVINKFMNNPQESHLKTIKHILQYVKGTIEFGIFFLHKENPKLTRWVGTNWACNFDNQRSTDGMFFKLGCNPLF
jgi:hypothetical protein